MASQFVRSIREVKDVNGLAEHTTTINDIVSDVDGNVYIRTINGFEKITSGDTATEIDSLKSEITSLKSEQTKLKNRVTALETPEEPQA